MSRQRLRRAGRIAVASAALGALLAPAAPLAAGDPPARPPASAGSAAPPPEARLAVTPERSVAGSAVTLDARASSGSIVRYRWDLDGDGRFEGSASEPATRHSFATPGDHRVGVRVEDGQGRSSDATATVTVAPARNTTATGAAPVRAARPQARAAARPRRRVVARDRRATAHAAGATAVSIQGFAFHPPTITVKPGDTITWTNQDSAPHTATGAGGSFNTGILKKGQSGSHTFASAGRFSYICAVHPGMHGTVVVAASGGSSGSSGGGANGSSTPSGTGGGSDTRAARASAASGSSTLPQTGLELVAITLTGLAFTSCGWLLHRFNGQRSNRTG